MGNGFNPNFLTGGGGRANTSDAARTLVLALGQIAKHQTDAENLALDKQKYEESQKYNNAILKLKQDKINYDREKDTQLKADILKEKSDKLEGLTLGSQLAQGIYGENMTHKVTTDVEDDTKNKDVYDYDKINPIIRKLSENGEINYKKVDGLSPEDRDMVLEYDKLKGIEDPVERQKARSVLNQQFFSGNKNISEYDASTIGSNIKGAAIQGVTTGLFPGLTPAIAGVKYIKDKVSEWRETPTQTAARVARENAFKEVKSKSGLTRNEESINKLKTLREKKAKAQEARNFNAQIPAKIKKVMDAGKTVKQGYKKEDVSVLDSPSTARQKLSKIYNTQLQKINKSGKSVDAKYEAIKRLQQIRDAAIKDYDSKYSEYAKNDLAKNKQNFEIYKLKLKSDLDRVNKEKLQFLKQNAPLTQKEKAQLEKLKKESRLLDKKYEKISKELE